MFFGKEQEKWQKIRNCLSQMHTKSAGTAPILCHTAIMKAGSRITFRLCRFTGIGSGS